MATTTATKSTTEASKAPLGLTLPKFELPKQLQDLVAKLPKFDQPKFELPKQLQDLVAKLPKFEFPKLGGQ